MDCPNGHRALGRGLRALKIWVGPKAENDLLVGAWLSIGVGSA